MIHTDHLQAMFDAAKAAYDNAYCQYSQFQVGAAVLDNQGRIYSGCNVENATFGATVCAERNAICHMIAEGGRVIKEILVISDVDSGDCTPCGICRQMAFEFMPVGEDITIYVANTQKIMKTFKLSELLPHAFCGELVTEPEITC